MPWKLRQVKHGRKAFEIKIDPKMLSRILGILAAATPASSMCPTSCPKGASCPFTGKKPTARPQVKPWPHNTGRAQLVSPPRDRLCYVEPAGDGDDDAPAMLGAFNECSVGGAVVLDGNYRMASALDLRFLETVDVWLSGTVSFSDDIDYWTANAFRLGCQNASAFWLWGGSDVNIYGGGTLDGRGQRWWDVFAANPSLVRPILFVTDGMNGGTFSGVNMINSPNVRKALVPAGVPAEENQRGKRGGGRGALCQEGSLTAASPPTHSGTTS